MLSKAGMCCLRTALPRTHVTPEAEQAMLADALKDSADHLLSQLLRDRRKEVRLKDFNAVRGMSGCARPMLSGRRRAGQAAVLGRHRYVAGH